MGLLLTSVGFMCRKALTVSYHLAVSPHMCASKGVKSTAGTADVGKQKL